MFHDTEELATHEYAKRAVASHTPDSVMVMLLMFAVPVVVVIVPVDVIVGATISIRLTVAVISPVLMRVVSSK